MFHSDTPMDVPFQIEGAEKKRSATARKIVDITPALLISMQTDNYFLLLHNNLLRTSFVE